MSSRSPSRCIRINRDLRKILGIERGGVPKTRKSMLEFRGETRARVVLIGGGGAVTGTVSSLFSWVWYASRDWPPTVRFSVESIFVFLFALICRSRESRAKLATKRKFFSLYFFGNSVENFLLNYRLFKNRPTLPELNHVQRRLHTCSRMQEQLLVILSWQDKRIIIWRRVSRCVRARFFLSISGKTHTLFASRGRDDYYADVQLAPDGWRNEVRCVGRRVDLVVLRNV